MIWRVKDLLWRVRDLKWQALEQALEQAEPSLAKSEEEKEIWRRRSEAYRKQLSRQNRKDGSELGVPHEHYRLSMQGCEEKVVVSTEMIAT